MSKKHSKNKEIKNRTAGVSFDIEENAEEIFLNYLNEDTGPVEKSEEPATLPKARKRTGKIPQVKIDLHGLTLDEACAALDEKVNQLRNGGQSRVRLRVVTGKGIQR